MSRTGCGANRFVPPLLMMVLLAVAMGASTLGAAGQGSPPNLLSAMNPSFERAGDGWRFSHSAAPSTVWAHDGAGYSSMHVTGSVTNDDVSAYSAFVPVAAGGTYSGRITGKIESALQGGMRLEIEWWNETSQLGSDTGSPAAGTGGTVSTASVTAAAPVGATQARLRAHDSGTGTWDVYLDAAMIVEGGVPGSFYAELPPNMLAAMNPSFEGALAGWSFSHSASPSTAWAYDGNGVSSAHVTGSVSNGDVSAYSALVPVAAGGTYSGRITGRVESPLQAGFRLELEWWNDSGSIGGVTGSAASGAEATPSVTAVAPAGATRARLRAHDSGSGTWDVHLDAAMIVAGGVPSHYYAAAVAPVLTTLAELPVPTLGSEVNVAPVPGSGPVFVGAGGQLVPLEEAEQIPTGSVLDTRRGSVKLVSATGSGSETQSGRFGGGVFRVLQSRDRRARGLTELRLRGASFSRCRPGPRGRNPVQRRRLSTRTIRRLRSNADGRFRLRGRHSAATVRSAAAWLTADRCDGTFTKVTSGRVIVRNLRHLERVVLSAGGSFLATAARRSRCRRPRCRRLGIVTEFERPAATMHSSHRRPRLASATDLGPVIRELEPRGTEAPLPGSVRSLPRRPPDPVDDWGGWNKGP